jgi:hypothetical protein
LNFGDKPKIDNSGTAECCLQVGGMVHRSPPSGSHASFKRGNENACTRNLNIAQCKCRATAKLRDMSRAYSLPASNVKKTS